ncbi:MAG: 4-hydroxy-3-methylbut-2-enyl diphosphate reductase [Candidatus Symbiobacter sp.]|nr:4-hydroxy-3-methylbut-2-enyl diphosphate reductase [Candidatus Symbiobacter sp.]
MRIILAEPRGFCAGVDRAIEIVERALVKFGPPIYVRHEIVHNRHVVQRLRDKGAVFVDDLAEVPDGAMTVFSAHGVARNVINEAKSRALPFIDGTCPLVTKVHAEGQRYAKSGRDIILIGHPGHPEVVGTLGQIDGTVMLVANMAEAEKLAVRDPTQLAYITQTTLSVDDTRAIIAVLKARFPLIEGPETRDICYATQNRQDAVRQLARQVDVMLVIGSQTSSNSNRLREIGSEMGIPSYLIDDGDDLKPDWLTGATTIGITAGASAPEDLVSHVVTTIQKFYPHAMVERGLGVNENVTFKIPAVLAD